MLSTQKLEEKKNFNTFVFLGFRVDQGICNDKWLHRTTLTTNHRNVVCIFFFNWWKMEPMNSICIRLRTLRPQSLARFAVKHWILFGYIWVIVYVKACVHMKTIRSKSCKTMQCLSNHLIRMHWKMVVLSLELFCEMIHFWFAYKWISEKFNCMKIYLGKELHGSVSPDYWT